MFSHWGQTIYWNTMSWEAFAAICAVIAAGWVGSRQIGITRKQTELQTLELKTALWDRRMAIYDTTRAYLAHIVLKGNVPGRSTMFGVTGSGSELAIEFHQAVDRAQFLLSPEAYARLSNVRATAERLATLREDARRMYEPKDSKSKIETAEARAALIEAYNNVAAIFADDLKLNTH